MADPPPDGPAGVASALRQVVELRGPGTLSDPVALSALLKDLLPDAPQAIWALVAAAETGVASRLIDCAAQGMDPRTAARLAAAGLRDATMLAPEARAWGNRRAMPGPRHHFPGRDPDDPGTPGLRSR